MHTIAGYHIKETIYKGMRSLVYRAVRDSDRRPVIIKTHAESYPDGELVNRLLREVDLGKKVNHKNVIRYLDTCRHGHGVALIEEDFGGRALTESIPKDGMAIKTFLDLAVQMAEGLAAIHEEGISHRDVKPANIVVNSSGTAKYIDFGLATELAVEEENPLEATRIEGTPAYLSPEQTGRMNRPVDYRTDFYSLGVTFYHMLSGRLPFQVEDRLVMVHSHIARTPPPLNSLRTDIPEGLVLLVERLMAKSPEERYRGARGLASDLQQCRKLFEKTGDIAYFEPGVSDFSDKFHISHKLYGREREKQLLLEAFDRTINGAKEVVLVAGYSGIGKTSLVREIHKPVVANHGFFVNGKFDQFRRHEPYAALIQAFDQLIGHLLTESEQSLIAWRRRLNLALKPNAKVLTDLIPRLAEFMGPGDELPQLGLNAAQERFHATFRHFIKVFARRENPLVIFLDDLQWADSGTLDLLRVFGRDPDSYLLVIGAYRDNEVGPGHPLLLALDDLRTMGTNIQSLPIQPLRRRDLEQLIADTLNRNCDSVVGLAELVERKTGGNPFFSGRFLESLYERRLITFNRETCSWEWDLTRIEAENITDNVVDLVLEKMRTLPAETCRLLRIASYLGNRFSLSVLTTAAELKPLIAARRLLPAVRAGLLAPDRHTYRWVKQIENAGAVEPSPESLCIILHFLHDRVQQAAGKLESATPKETLHLEIGRRLLRTFHDRDEHLFLIVEQMNLGRDLIRHDSERTMLARLNTRVGTRAEEALAYEAAVLHYSVARELLDESAWQFMYDLIFQVYRNEARCLWKVFQIDKANELLDTILKHNTDPVDRADVFGLRMRLFADRYEWGNAQIWGLETLRALGYNIPGEDALRTTTPAQRQLLEARLEKTPFSKILDRTVDGKAAAIVQEVMLLLCAGGFIGDNIHQFAYWLFRGLNQIWLNGCSKSTISFLSWGATFYLGQDRFREGLHYARLAICAHEKQPDPVIGSVLHCNVGHALTLADPTEKILANYEKGFRLGMENGDPQTAVHTLCNKVTWLFKSGYPLATVAAQIDEVVNVTLTYGYKVPLGMTLIYKGLVQALMGREKQNGLAEEAFDPEIYRLILAGNVYPFLLMAEFQRFFWLGREKDALSIAAKARASLAKISGLMVWVDTEVLYAVLLADCDHCPERVAEIEAIGRRLETPARMNPTFYQARYLLVLAEHARLRGRPLTAVGDLYESAAEAAARGGFLNFQALANERHALLWLAEGRKRYAALHLREARYYYRRWDAEARVRLLDRRYPDLVPAVAPLMYKGDGESNPSHDSHATTGSSSEGPDFDTITRTTRAISGEIELSNLMRIILQSAVECAGADKGVLLLDDNDQLKVHAVFDAATGRASIEPEDKPFEESDTVPASLVRFASRGRRVLVIHDEAEMTRFVTDPYIQNLKPLSVLCLPLIHADHGRGLLYLENKLTRYTFTDRRVDMLGVLLAQAAISLENARLYNETQRWKEILEERVKQRTQQLEQARDELVEKARLAGMADIAINVLHNLGNVLNSVVISSQAIHRNLVCTRAKGLDRAGKLMKTLVIEDIRRQNPRADKLVRYFTTIGEVLKQEREDGLGHVRRIEERVEDIRDVIAAQERYVSGGRQAETLPLSRILDEAVGISEGVLSRHDVRVKPIVESDPVVPVQRIKLIHALINLIENAVEAMDDIPKEERTLSVHIGEENGKAVMRFIDRGTGIPGELIEKIFSHGFTTHEKGKGFGLHTCANALAEMGGRVWAESGGVGLGATFVVTLPIVITKEIPESAKG
ncbi:MAG: AAA family ATPase [Acidobacteriota bacterium]|nr:AAA family ATPase [Acidobacteriota bacterium]